MSTKKIVIVLFGTLLIFALTFNIAFALSDSASYSGSLGGVSYLAEKHVALYPGAFQASVTSSAVSSMGRIGITYWTAQLHCNSGADPVWYTIGAALNYNSSYFSRTYTQTNNYACDWRGMQFMRSTGNHEFNMGTPVYKFLEAKYP